MCGKERGHGMQLCKMGEGLSWAKVQGDADKWRVDHPYVGKQVIKQFGNKLYAGHIQKWMPGSKQEWELWHIKYEDGDEEDAETHDLVRIVVDNSTNPGTKCDTTKPVVVKPNTRRKQTQSRPRQDNTGRNAKKKKKIDTNTLHTNKNRYGGMEATMGHDTLRSGQVVGRIHAANRHLNRFLTHIEGETKGTLEDGHCLRRSLAKLWGIQPGQVINKLREGGEHVTKHGGKLKIESDNAWYEQIQQRPDHWGNIIQNEWSNCTREEWGGENEVQLWAYITQTTIVVTNKVGDFYTVYNPNVHEIPTMKQTDTLQEMHDQLKQEGQEPAYLIYNGVHYNPIIHGRQGELVMREAMPEWVDPPPKRKRTEQLQEGMGGESEDDEAGHKHEDVVRRKRTKTMIQTTENEQKKRKPSDNESDLNAQEYKSRKKKSETQVSEE